VHDLGDVTHEYVEYPQDQTQGQSENQRDADQHGQPQPHPARLVSDHDENADGGQEQEEIIQQTRTGNDQRQADARKHHLLQQTGVVDEDRQTAGDYLREQRPRRQTGQQVDHVGITVGGAWKFAAQNPRKHQRVDGALRQRLQDHPYGAQAAARETRAQVVAYRGQNEMAVLPDREQHQFHGAGSSDTFS